jgi:hypothetical protein
VFSLLNPGDEYPDLEQGARVMMKVLFMQEDAPPFEPMTVNELVVRTTPEAPWPELDKVIQCTPDLYWHLWILVGRYSIAGHEYLEKDIEIARQILGSVECVPVKTPSSHSITDLPSSLRSWLRSIDPPVAVHFPLAIPR